MLQIEEELLLSNEGRRAVVAPGGAVCVSAVLRSHSGRHTGRR
jgi:hypothetical protein